MTKKIMNKDDNEYLKHPWIYKDKTFNSEDIKDYNGFVYLITQKSTGKKYIGKKFFWSKRKVKNQRNRQIKESDWKKYFSSSDILKECVKIYGKDDFTREILYLHEKEAAINYYEVKLQFEYGVLETDDWFNDNINGKWFSKNVKNYLSLDSDG